MNDLNKGCLWWTLKKVVLDSLKKGCLKKACQNNCFWLGQKFVQQSIPILNWRFKNVWHTISVCMHGLDHHGTTCSKIHPSQPHFKLFEPSFRCLDILVKSFTLFYINCSKMFRKKCERRKCIFKDMWHLISLYAASYPVTPS